MEVAKIICNGLATKFYLSTLMTNAQTLLWDIYTRWLVSWWVGAWRGCERWVCKYWTLVLMHMLSLFAIKCLSTSLLTDWQTGKGNQNQLCSELVYTISRLSEYVPMRQNSSKTKESKRSTEKVVFILPIVKGIVSRDGCFLMVFKNIADCFDILMWTFCLLLWHFFSLFLKIHPITFCS